VVLGTWEGCWRYYRPSCFESEQESCQRGFPGPRGPLSTESAAAWLGQIPAHPEEQKALRDRHLGHYWHRWAWHQAEGHSGHTPGEEKRAAKAWLQAAAAAAAAQDMTLVAAAVGTQMPPAVAQTPEAWDRTAREQAHWHCSGQPWCSGGQCWPVLREWRIRSWGRPEPEPPLELEPPVS
jgi:hypothetical protein